MFIFQVVVVQAISALCQKYPRKHGVMMNFLSNMLRDDVSSFLDICSSVKLEPCNLFSFYAFLVPNHTTRFTLNTWVSYYLYFTSLAPAVLNIDLAVKIIFLY